MLRTHIDDCTQLSTCLTDLPLVPPSPLQAGALDKLYQTEGYGTMVSAVFSFFSVDCGTAAVPLLH